jgi:hypothetical protein
MLIQEMSHKDLKENWFGKIRKISEEEADIWDKRLNLCWPLNLSCVSLQSSFWPIFPYFGKGKIKERLCDLHVVCVSEYPML